MLSESTMTLVKESKEFKYFYEYLGFSEEFSLELAHHILTS